MTETNSQPAAGALLPLAPLLAGIYRDVDGFYYYHPPVSGSYSAHTLREIAEKLDEMNKPWAEQLDRALNHE